MEQDIFRRGSTTYYWASKFFPKNVRDDVFDLYSFVRLADDYVDQVPADSDGFYHLRRLWMEANQNMIFSTKKSPDDSPDERVVKNIVRLVDNRRIKRQWVDLFLDTMQSDLVFRPKNTIENSLKYTSGSAETVGLMMAKVMDLPNQASEAARMQGRAMQWLNFIRDIEEDNRLGRLYFPREDLKRFKLKDLSQKTAEAQPEEFINFIHFQIERYKLWQQEAAAGYKFIPKKLLTPIKTAAEMHSWTADQIAKDPLIVFQKKIKPSKLRICSKILTNMV
jgi:15-cis-phytoene synthase